MQKSRASSVLRGSVLSGRFQKPMRAHSNRFAKALTSHKTIQPSCQRSCQNLVLSVCFLFRLIISKCSLFEIVRFPKNMMLLNELGFSWIIWRVPGFPKINNIRFGSHGHVRKARNHENDGFSVSPIVKSKSY